MRIAIIDPFLDDSHKYWAESIQDLSQYQVDIIGKGPTHWKWKMTGGSMELAYEFNKRNQVYDLLFATDMLNLPLFWTLLDRQHHKSRIALYFHENQITYPWSTKDRDVKQNRDYHYGFINFTSALAANGIIFNSVFHAENFIRALPPFLKRFPSFRFDNLVQTIKEKSMVLPIGIHPSTYHMSKAEVPVFIWNHRWEYDKNPDTFFQTLFQLKERGVKFELIILGKKFDVIPSIFEEAERILKPEIVHMGFAEKEDYHRLLQRANMLLITSHQDFFGISTIEAISAGCLPIIPNRLAYKEHIPPNKTGDVVYDSDADILDILLKLIATQAYKRTLEYKEYVDIKYDWGKLIQRYDTSLMEIIDQT